MKLTQRINVILLPVIAGIFIVTTWILNGTTEDQARLVYEQQLKQAANNISYRINYETSLADSIFSQTINSHEYANYIADPSTHVLYDSLEILLNRQREQIRIFMPGLLSAQIINAHGDILFSADDRDIFEEPILPPIPKTHQHWLDSTQKDKSSKESFLFKSKNGAIHLARLHTFNSEFLSTATRKHKDDNKIIYFLIVIDADYLRIGTPTLQRDFLDSFEIDLNINQNIHSGYIPEHIALGKKKTFMSVDFTHALFDATINIKPSFVSEQLDDQKTKQWFLTIALILFSYTSLLSLIHRQIINPILTLTNQVRSGKKIIINKTESDDEVSELNNTYVKLIGEVEKLAQFDPLTNLANRASFKTFFARVLARCLHKNEPLALLYIDLDNFKQVNDHYGHDVGDQLLVEFSERLWDSIRTTDACSRIIDESSVARLAGDEFAVILPDASPETAAIVAKRLLGLFKGGFSLGQHKHNVKASIGIAMAPDDGEEISELTLHADAAMYQAKASGRNCYQFFTKKIADEMKEKLDIQREIESALDQDQFHLVYMPIYDAKNLTIVGLEVLLRSNNSLLNRCGPEKFIPVAESTGLIKRIDMWVIENALIKMNELKEIADYKGNISINMSAVELHNKDFPKKVERLLEYYNTPPENVDLEVTETSLVSHDDHSIQTLNALKALGVSISLDDFGTGYTAFNQLIHYPVDYLKIDRSFVSALDTNEDKDKSMLEIIAQMAKLYGLKTTAEGVETQEQLDYLIKLGCDYLQGYYLCKPVSEIGLIKLLNEQKERDFHK